MDKEWEAIKVFMRLKKFGDRPVVGSERERNKGDGPFPGLGVWVMVELFQVGNKGKGRAFPLLLLRQ